MFLITLGCWILVLLLFTHVKSSCLDAYGCFGESSVACGGNCDADSSCVNVDSIGCSGNTATQGIYGAYAAQNSTIIQPTDCRALDSCRYTTWTDYDTRCFGFRSCADSNLLFGEGSGSLNDNQDGFGPFSFANSTIESGDSFNTYQPAEFYGYLAGYGATLTCNSGHSCEINCYDNGCYKLNLHCVGTCYVDCSATSTDCPIITGTGAVYPTDSKNLTDYSDDSYDSFSGSLIPQSVLDRMDYLTRELNQEICGRNGLDNPNDTLLLSAKLCDDDEECTSTAVISSQNNQSLCCRMYLM